MKQIVKYLLISICYILCSSALADPPKGWIPLTPVSESEMPFVQPKVDR